MGRNYNGYEIYDSDNGYKSYVEIYFAGNYVCKATTPESAMKAIDTMCRLAEKEDKRRTRRTKNENKRSICNHI